MNNWSRRLLLVLSAACLAAGAAHADDERGVQVIVGRADADASGGWPVAVWVLDGERSQLILRAPRDQLAELPGQPWEPVGAAALLDLERHGAPRLARRADYDPCPSTLYWGWPAAHPFINHHGFLERPALTHGPCGGPSCDTQAWRIRLSSEAVLPLRTLMPGLVARQPQWLVLHVVSPERALRLAGVPMLAPPAPWSLGRPGEGLYDLPWEASPHFPAIHAAMLERAAAGQGLAQGPRC